MKLIDSIIDFMTNDVRNDEFIRKHAVLWAVLFVSLGIMLFIAALFAAFVPIENGNSQIAFTLLFSLMGMLLILIGERIYRNRSLS